MSGAVGPLNFVLIALAGWMNQRQQLVVYFLLAANRILKHQLDRKRLRLTDEQRRLLAVKRGALGRKVLNAVATIVTPDTIMPWYRQLVAKWNYSSRRGPGRPPVIALAPQPRRSNGAREPVVGYDRIEGETKKLGHRLSPTTVRNILRENGIEPAPERRKRTTWRQFLSAHWDCLAAPDFFTVEVCSWRGLVTYYVLFFMGLSTRRVHVAGITQNDVRWRRT